MKKYAIAMAVVLGCVAVLVLGWASWVLAHVLVDVVGFDGAAWVSAFVCFLWALATSAIAGSYWEAHRRLALKSDFLEGKVLELEARLKEEQRSVWKR